MHSSPAEPNSLPHWRSARRLGLIYVAIRTIATGQFHALFEIIKVLTWDLIRVRKLLHDQSVDAISSNLKSRRKWRTA